jgi:hypothetical protein
VKSEKRKKEGNMEAVKELVGAVLNDAEVGHHVALAHACDAQIPKRQRHGALIMSKP